MPNVSDNKRVDIGGVSFNKADVKSAQKVKENGKELNSVFLRDNTEVRYSNQAKGNEATINLNEDKTEGHYKYTNRWNGQQVTQRGADFYDAFGGKVDRFDVKKEYVEPKSEFQVDFYRLNGAKINGTDKEDRYALNGCRNTSVDVSNDGATQDLVDIRDDNAKSKYHHSSGKSFKSGNNQVKQGDNDGTMTINRNAKWYQSNTKTTFGKGTVKE